METCDSTTTREDQLHRYFLDKGVVGIDPKYRYERRGAKETLARMQAETGIIVEGHLLRVFRNQGFDLDPVRDNKSVYKPEAMFDALEKYTPTKVTYNDTVLRQAIALCHKAFGHQEMHHKLKPLVFDYELMSAVKLDKASGAPLFAKKADAFESDLKRSERIAQNHCAPPPCVAFHRVQHGAEGPKVRLVWGYPLSMTLLEARFARPLIDRFLELRTPMTFGLVKHQVGGRVLECQRSGVVYALDFSKFDSSLPTRLVHTAFEVLKTHFELTAEQENVWDKVVNYFIHTTILMPDGWVYQKHCGVPSGSYFTQLVDSLVNYIVIQYMALLVTGRPVNDRLINVLGDDSLFTLSDWVDTEEFAKIASTLGMTVNVSKSGRYRQGEAPVFLGHEWHAGIPDRPVLEVVKRIVFPERPSPRAKSQQESEERELSRLIAYTADAKCAWDLVLRTKLLGDSNNMTAFHTLHRRHGYPITGMEEIQSLLGEGLPTTAKTLMFGLIR